MLSPFDISLKFDNLQFEIWCDDSIAMKTFTGGKHSNFTKGFAFVGTLMVSIYCDGHGQNYCTLEPKPGCV